MVSKFNFTSYHKVRASAEHELNKRIATCDLIVTFPIKR